MDIWLVFLIVNYVALAASFVYAYFTPKQSAEWLTKITEYYFIMYIVNITVLVGISQIILKFSDLSGNPVCGFFFVIMYFVLPLMLMFYFTKKLQNNSITAIVSFVLYVLSLGQEAAYTFLSKGVNGLEQLYIILALGIVFVGLGSKLGRYFDKYFPTISAEHQSIAVSNMRDKGGRSMSPGELVAFGVFYSIFMIIVNVIMFL